MSVNLCSFLYLEEGFSYKNIKGAKHCNIHNGNETQKQSSGQNLSLHAKELL